jgi:hypothetical protein
MNSEIDGYFIEAGVPRALVLPDVEVERASAGALAAEVLRGFAPLLRPAVVRSRRPVGIETTLGSPSLLQGIRKFGIVIDRQNFDAIHTRLADKGACLLATCLLTMVWRCVRFLFRITTEIWCSSFRGSNPEQDRADDLTLVACACGDRHATAALLDVEVDRAESVIAAVFAEHADPAAIVVLDVERVAQMEGRAVAQRDLNFFVAANASRISAMCLDVIAAKLSRMARASTTRACCATAERVDLRERARQHVLDLHPRCTHDRRR